jgi:hypothetical protein
LRAGGEPPAELLGELKEVATRVARFGGFPPALAPYGVWNDEAADEVFQAWLTHRLLGEGALQSLVDKARTPGALRRMAELSLRQHILNSRTRTQSQNLYERCMDLLRDDERFSVARESTRAAEVWWELHDAPAETEWAGDDRLLLAHAWSLGEFEIIRYRAGAQKLAPVLDAASLERFVIGMFAATGCRLTVGLLARALELRFDLQELAPQTLEAREDGDDPADQALDVGRHVALEQTTSAVLAELTRRQCEVILSTRAEETLDEMARRLDCSPATISNEQGRVALVIDRYSDGVDERDLLLRMVGDALYQEGETA